MTELYADIPDEVREGAEFIVNLALAQRNPLSAVRMVKEYADSCLNDYEKEFVDFYFNLRLEQLRNENSDDKR